MYAVHVELATASGETKQCETVPTSKILKTTRKLRSHTTDNQIYYIPSRISLAEASKQLSEVSASGDDDVFAGETTIKFHKGRQVASDSVEILQSAENQTKIVIPVNLRKRSIFIAKLEKTKVSTAEKGKSNFNTYRDPITPGSETDSDSEIFEGAEPYVNSDDSSNENDFLVLNNGLGQENLDFQEKL